MRYGFIPAFIAAVILLAVSWSPAEAIEGYAEHTPGYNFLAQGTRSYEAGRYFDAKHRFRQAAHWADKLAQFNLGIMYFNGEGVARDPARSWAWFELSAEREYPQMVEAAELVWDRLDERQRAEARRILEQELLPDYGDEVAIERTAARMQQQRRRATGSRLGFVGNITIIDRSGRSRNGSDFYREERWDFNRIVKLETRIFEAAGSGQVTIGDTEVVEDSGE